MPTNLRHGNTALEMHTIMLNSLKSQWIRPCSARWTTRPIIVSKTMSGFCNCFTCTLHWIELIVNVYKTIIYQDQLHSFYIKANSKRTETIEITRFVKRNPRLWKLSARYLHLLILLMLTRAFGLYKYFLEKEKGREIHTTNTHTHTHRDTESGYWQRKQFNRLTII